MKENYKPWNVNPEDFSRCKTRKEEILFLINFAILAPSSHNSQPWSFFVEKDYILVYLNKDRKLNVGDKNNRLLFLSIGCAIKNILIAADFYGFSFFVKYFPDIEDRELVAFILLEREVFDLKNADHLIFSIPRRSVNRYKYEDKKPPSIFFEQVRSLNSSQLKIQVITDKNIKNRISEAAVNSSIVLMDSNEFRKELSHYVKNNYTKSKIGIPAFGMGIPGFISLFISALVKYINVDKLSRRRAENLLKNFSPFLLIISTNHDREIDWLQSGEVYQQIALICENYGMKTSIMGAPVLVDECYKLIQAELGDSFRPQVFFRLGYVTKKDLNHSPRLSVSDVLRS